MLKKKVFNIILVIIALSGLYLISFYNYLLFHSLVEFFSVVIAFTVFIITWNTYPYIQNNALLFIGMFSVFIGGLDFLHTLSYRSMGVFENSEDYATRLWVATRYLESVSFLLAFPVSNMKKKISARYLLFGYSVIVGMIIYSIFFSEIFPICFVEGDGLTPFKVISEYVIMGILLVAIYFLYRYRKNFDGIIRKYLFYALSFTILAEFAFTLYNDVYDINNMIGHYFKLFSFYLVYMAIIEKGLREPYSLIFKELKENERELQYLNNSKDRFFSIIAHDLKNPFNSLLNFSQLLFEKESLSKEKRIKYAQYIYTSAYQGYVLLENLLQWSRSQMNKLKIKQTDVNANDIIAESIQLHATSASAKNISIINTIREPLWIFADHDMVYTVFRNLISNALKYSFDGSRVEIGGKEEGQYVTISVTDYGIGMTPHEKEDLFRIDKNPSKEGTHNEAGTGLGMILVQDFVEKNNGILKIHSEKDNGTEIVVKFPKL